MEKDMILSNTQLFRGIEEQEIPSLFQCLGASKSEYKKGEVILAEGTVTQNVGIILSGQAIISHNDVWGNTSILGNAAPGDVIAEVYASIPGQPLLITVSAAEDTTVMFLNVGAYLNSLHQCMSVHTKLVHNLLTVCARKSAAALAEDSSHRLENHPGQTDVLFFRMRQNCRQQSVYNTI